MTDAYYEPHALLTLDQPLVLVGHPGSGVSQVGRAIAGRTGLAFRDVERNVESVAGRSRARVLVEDGFEGLRALESAALRKAVRRPPFGVVVVESGALEPEAQREWLRDRCTLVYVRLDDEVLLARIEAQVKGAPGSLPEFLMGAPDRVDELRSHFESRERALGDIDIIVEAEGGHPARAANEILASLDRLMSVERIGV